MAHYCRICGAHKSNESFSGRGHRNHICKKCSRLPKVERRAIDEKNEIYNYLRQSNISKNNIKRLRALTESTNEEVSYYAQIVLDISIIKPHKKRRLKFLAENNRDLLNKLEETGLIFAHR